MEKINIVTYYNANNYGAFLQAYALWKFLTSNGFSVSFKGLKIKQQIRDSYSLELNRLLSEAQKLLPLDWSDSRYDITIIGSDEVFNYNNPTYGNFPYFKGIALNSKKIVSYAASIGGANYKKLLLKHFLDFCKLRNLDWVSVRDRRTEKFLKIFYHKCISRDVDPTLLIDFDEEIVSPAIDKYVLVYTYGMKSEHISFIKKYAADRRLKIIATGSFCPWCDQNLIVSPFEWIGLIKKAEYVFTSTFHGTIFSLKYKKQFLALVNNSEKVKELLESLEIQERYCQITNYNDILNLVNSKIDYSKINITEYALNSQKRLLELIG